MTLEQFSALPKGRRKYFLKYAGANVARNWGSRAVFRLDTEAHDKCLARLRTTVERYTAGERWILQCDRPSDQEISFISRAGEIETTAAHSKHSTFYGPQGALGAKTLFEKFFKVLQSTESILTVNLLPDGDADATSDLRDQRTADGKPRRAR